MIGSLCVALATLTIGSFNVGPVQFALDSEVTWQLTVHDKSIEIDLDTLEVRGVKGPGQVTTAVLPFRSKGKLSAGACATSDRIPWWPQEWSDCVGLQVRFLARRPENLWHERLFEQRVDTYHSTGRFQTNVGQRYTLIPDHAPAPALEALDGRKVEARNLAYHVLRLEEIKPGEQTTYRFQVGIGPHFVIFRTSLPILANPWFDGIVGTRDEWTGKAAYVKGRKMTVVSPDGKRASTIDTKFQPMRIFSVFMTAKPRICTNTFNELDLDGENLSLQPIWAVVRPGSGFFGNDIYSPWASEMQTPTDTSRIEYIVARHKTHRGLSASYSWLSPQGAFPGKKLEWIAKAEPKVGMTPEQVEWLLGPPVAVLVKGEDKVEWIYRWTPTYSYQFLKRKLAKIEIGRLP